MLFLTTTSKYRITFVFVNSVFSVYFRKTIEIPTDKGANSKLNVAISNTVISPDKQDYVTVTLR